MVARLLEVATLRRWLPPSALVFALSLLGSLAVHLPAYEVLGHLASRWRTLALQGTGRRSGPAEVEVVFEPRQASAPKAERQPDPQPPKVAPPEPEEVRQAHRSTEKPADLPRPEEQLLPPLRARPPAPAPPPEPVQRLAVTQRGNQQQAEDARFIAREANRVEEETVARARNLVRDDPEPSVEGRPEPRAAQGEGTARDDVVAELRDRDGARDRQPTEEQARAERPPRPAPGRVPRRPDPSRVERPSDAPGRTADSSSEAEPPRRAEAEPSRRAEANTPLVVSDGQGTLRFEVQRAGGASGERPTGARRRARRRIALAPRRPGEQPSYSELQAVYGEQRLEGERQAWLLERRSRRAGARFGASWQQFRAAIENHVPAVRPGNQTALNAAASPFADYLAAVHRRIHVQYAENFIGRLPTYSTSPYADRSLHVELEIVVAPNGSVHRIAVVKSSGLLPFDYGAYAAVMRAQPFPRPPRAIRSADGRVYFHWGFYRNPRLCGTFNARPFILRSVPGEPARRDPGPRDEPAPRPPPERSTARQEAPPATPAEGG